MSRNAATGGEGTCMFVHMKKEEITLVYGYVSAANLLLSLQIALVLLAA